MNREKITITDEGTITVPDSPVKVRMTIIEIADLLGIFYPTAKRHIRSIEKSGVAGGDYSMRCVCDGHSVHPDYYGLEMIAALAFRINTRNAAQFRRWLMERATQRPGKPVSVFISGERKQTAELITNKRASDREIGRWLFLLCRLFQSSNLLVRH